MVLLGTTPEVPAPGLVALASRVEDAARDAARSAAEPFDRDLRRVSDSLAMWSIALRRMAESGPRAHLVGLQDTFPEHYPDPIAVEPLAGHAARLDVVAFLAVGDMVLDDLAKLILNRDQQAVGEVPWRTLMRRLDAGGSGGSASMVRAARALDLILREGRTRLVAHRLVDHVSLYAWASDGTQEVDLVNPDGVGRAYEHLVDVADRVGIAHDTPAKVEPGDYYTILRRILARAGELDDEHRNLVKRAFREAGYTFGKPARIVDAVLALVRDARAHPRVDAAWRPF